MKEIMGKLRKVMDATSEVLERIMAAIVFIVIVVAIVSLYEPFLNFWNHRMVDGSFLIFMGYVLNIVIGIEFFKMLCKPGADTVLEVLMFVVARHMIIHETTAMENLLTILGIAVIFTIKKYLHTERKGAEKAEVSQEMAEVSQEMQRE